MRFPPLLLTLLSALAAGTAVADPVNLALNKPTITSSTCEWSHPDDGHGAVDGVINGKFGFHTDEEKNPWWQVDLGRVEGISEVVVYRLDCCSERSQHLVALISEDGEHWREVYAHNGPAFGGRDGRPLHILVNDDGRFVRLRLREEHQAFHLDEVQVLGAGRRIHGPPPVVNEAGGVIVFADANYNGPEQFGDTFPYLNTPTPGASN